MRALHCGALALTAAAFTACASASPSQKTTYDEPPALRWSGSLQPTQGRTAEVQATTLHRASGTMAIEIPSGADNMKRARVTLVIALPELTGSQLRWAVLPDRCGSGDLPLIGFEQFPLLEIGSNGRGELKADLPLELVANNSYHINVYNGGQQLTDVFACGNLRYENRR
ncbi:MAG: hypothetical protein M3Z05_15345 [Gemmatimonadota bacterium]|nr:hypothetical protein [Gemmatimonadota bacterium]